MAPITIMKKREVASIPMMHRLVLKRIFDKKNMTYEEESLLDQSVGWWPKKLNLTLTERRHLKIILQTLLFDEQGKFNEMKEMIVKHQLDYRQVYRGGL